MSWPYSGYTNFTVWVRSSGFRIFFGCVSNTCHMYLFLILANYLSVTPVWAISYIDSQGSVSMMNSRPVGQVSARKRIPVYPSRPLISKLFRSGLSPPASSPHPLLTDFSNLGFPDQTHDFQLNMSQINSTWLKLCEGFLKLLAYLKLKCNWESRVFSC